MTPEQQATVRDALEVLTDTAKDMTRRCIKDDGHDHALLRRVQAILPRMDALYFSSLADSQQPAAPCADCLLCGKHAPREPEIQQPAAEPETVEQQEARHNEERRRLKQESWEAYEAEPAPPATEPNYRPEELDKLTERGFERIYRNAPQEPRHRFVPCLNDMARNCGLDACHHPGCGKPESDPRHEVK